MNYQKLMLILGFFTLLSTLFAISPVSAVMAGITSTPTQPPTDTPVPPTATAVPPTATPNPPTKTPRSTSPVVPPPENTAVPTPDIIPELGAGAPISAARFGVTGLILGGLLLGAGWYQILKNPS